MWAPVPCADAGELTSRGWDCRTATLELIQDGETPTVSAVHERARHVTPRARQLAEREACTEQDPWASAAEAAEAAAAAPKQPGLLHCVALCTCIE